MRVSVITPVWNAAATLAPTVASVRAQSAPDWEMWLVDDGSTDGSRELAAFVGAYTAKDRKLRAELRGWIWREQWKLALHRIGYRLSGSTAPPPEAPSPLPRA